jgi:hypothetical protein
MIILVLGGSCFLVSHVWDLLDEKTLAKAISGNVFIKKLNFTREVDKKSY